MTFDLLLIGLAITLDPLPVSAQILLLGGERGIRNGIGFVLGWMLTLAGVVVLTLLVTGGKPLSRSSAPSPWLSGFW
jgi:threonine/homoserine/homoserine lactone efflux protein